MINAHYATLAEYVKNLVVGLPVSEHCVDDALDDEVDFAAPIATLEQILRGLYESLFALVVQLFQEVLFDIAQVSYVLAAYLHEFVSVIIVRIPQNLVTEILADVWISNEKIMDVVV